MVSLINTSAIKHVYSTTKEMIENMQRGFSKLVSAPVKAIMADQRQEEELHLPTISSSPQRIVDIYIKPGAIGASRNLR